ncbi:MAG: response regulator [Scytolyngbya sp. HA4215-MV1]|nr:response regulator [Scytolyngbya sp. HA4215-MV1]
MTRRVLLIDDEVPLRRVTQLTLEITAGWQVLAVGSGLEGLKQAEIEHPDVILLDLMMPDMDGMVTLTLLRENPETRSIPVILLTAKVQTMDPLWLQKLGVVAVLTKPFEPVHLVEQMKTALGWS